MIRNADEDAEGISIYELERNKELWNDWLKQENAVLLFSRNKAPALMNTVAFGKSRSALM